MNRRESSDLLFEQAAEREFLKNINEHEEEKLDLSVIICYIRNSSMKHEEMFFEKS